MVAVNRVFAAQLAGLPVFGPDGESIGKARDIVIGLRIDRQPPRVLGMVVELATRQRIFVPMLRVNSIEPNAVTLATGSVSLRRFHQRANEVLVVGQLLDARVSLDSGSPAVLVDAAMEPTRTKDWRVVKVAVRERTGRLARRGPLQVLRWEEISGVSVSELSGQPQGAQQLLSVFETMRAVDVATTMHDLPAKRRYEVADAMDDERLADVIEELPEEDQKDLLAYLDDERAADILETMDPDDAADLLAELSEFDKDRLLALMEPEESEPVKRLLEYKFDTAGGLMTPEPVVLDTDLARLGPDASLAEVTRYFAAYNLVCAPVVDDADHLLGAVTVDDVLDHLLPDNWRETGLSHA